MKNKFLFILIFFGLKIFSQSFIKEFNSIEEFITNQNISFFVADDGIHGFELWKNNSLTKETTLIKDIYKGHNSSTPSNLFIFNDELYFSANDGINGNELWKSDGTEEGTFLVKDISTNNKTSSNPNNFIEYNSELFFFAKDSFNMNYIWKTDGTNSGTSVVYDAQYSSLSKPTLINNELFFVQGSVSLWKLSGEELNASNIYVDEYSFISELNSFNGNLYLITHTNYYRSEIRFYRMDDENNFILLNEYNQPTYGDIDIFNFTEVGDEIFFSVTTDFNSEQDTDVLWKTDGTTLGTVPVKSFNWDRHLSGSEMTNFIVYKNELYFNGGSQNGNSIWKSNGTETGTVEVSNSSVNNDYPFIISGNLLYFVNSSRTLWSTDGTESNTVQFSNNIIASQNYDDNFSISSNENKVFFETIYGDNTTALFTTDLAPVIEVKQGYSSIYNNENIDFQSKIDSLATKTFKIKNIGNENLVFSKVEITGKGFYINGENSSNVTETNTTENFPRIIYPNEEYEITIGFFPSNNTFEKGKISIISNDYAIPHFIFNLSGYVTNEEAINSPLNVFLDKEILFSDHNININLDNNEIEESLPTDSIVGFFNVLNTTDDFTFELITGEGDTGNNNFIIDNNTLLSNTLLNYNLTNTYSIRVKAYNDSISYEENFIVSVKKVNEDVVLGECGKEIYNLSYSLNDVEYIDNNNILAIGSDGIILKSYDSGNNWSSIESGSKSYLDNLQFVTDKIGYILGDEIILKTEDGGENWFPLDFIDYSYPFPSNLFFIDTNTGFVFGDDGKLFKTLDGGKSWNSKSIGRSDFNAAFFINESKGFLCGDSKTLAKTIDGGETWEFISLDIDELGFSTRFHDIYFINDLTGFIIGSEGEVLKTVDGGETWSFSTEFPSVYLTKIKFQDENVGYILGGFNYSYLYKTNDGGTTWSEEDIENIGDLTNIAFSKNGEKSTLVGYGSGFGSGSEDGRSIYNRESNGSWSIKSSLRPSYDYNAVYFSDNLGFVFGEYDTYRKTIDGGITWTPITLPESTAVKQAEIIDNELYILGESLLFKSSDLGENWDTISIPRFNQLYFVNSVIYASSFEYGVYKSIDGGLNWNLLNNSNEFPFDIHFTDDLKGYVIEFQNIYKTIDGGITFETISPEENSDILYSVKFFNENIGLVGGGNGVFYKTSDAGATWTKIKTIISRDIRFIEAKNELEWYAISAYGGTSVLYKSNDGGLTWSHLYQSAEIHDVHLDFDNEKIYAVGAGGNFYKLSDSSKLTLPNHIAGETIVHENSLNEYNISGFLDSQYIWEVTGNNDIIFDNNTVKIKWNEIGTHTLSVIPYNSCELGAPREINITVLADDPLPEILGNDEVNSISTEPYSTFFHDGYQYQWSVNGANNFTTDINNIVIEWGEYDVTANVSVIQTNENTGSRKVAQMPITINETLSINDNFDNSSINLYPNPTEGNITLSFNSSFIENNKRIEIFNIAGKLVFSEDLIVYNNSLDLNITNLKSGLYLLKIDFEYFKIIKN